MSNTLNEKMTVRELELEIELREVRQLLYVANARIMELQAEKNSVELHSLTSQLAELAAQENPVKEGRESVE